MPGGKAWGTQYFGREGSYWQNFSTEVKNGKITEDRVTEAVTRILSSMYLLNQMENFPIKNLTVDTVTDERVALQRQAATESQVLLKNDGILPIKTPTSKKTIAVIGNAAFPRDCENGDSDHQCYNNTNHVSNGHIPIGYGSGTTDFKYLVTPLEGITNMAELKGYDVISSGQMFYTIDETKDKYSEHDIKECAKDICLFVDNINKTNYQACQKKYSKPEQENVAIFIMNNNYCNTCSLLEIFLKKVLIF